MVCQSFCSATASTLRVTLKVTVTPASVTLPSSLDGIRATMAASMARRSALAVSSAALAARQAVFSSSRLIARVHRALQKPMAAKTVKISAPTRRRPAGRPMPVRSGRGFLREAGAVAVFGVQSRAAVAALGAALVAGCAGAGHFFPRHTAHGARRQNLSTWRMPLHWHKHRPSLCWPPPWRG